MTNRHVLSMLILSALPLMPAAQDGTVSLSPEWAQEPKQYATTEALWADSLGLAWDGDSAVVVRLRIVEVIKNQGDRFLAGDSLRLEPGSMRVRLADMLAPLMIGGSIPVIRWAEAAAAVPGEQLTTRRWKDAVFAELLGEDSKIDWTTEAVLVIGFSVEVAGRTSPDMVQTMLVVRPAPSDSLSHSPTER